MSHPSAMSQPPVVSQPPARGNPPAYAGVKSGGVSQGFIAIVVTVLVVVAIIVTVIVLAVVMSDSSSSNDNDGKILLAITQSVAMLFTPKFCLQWSSTGLASVHVIICDGRFVQ